MSGIIPVLAPALVARWSALSALTSVDAVVKHGAPIGGMSLRRFVGVEFDGRPEAQENSTFVQEWLDLACTRRREEGEIRCSAIAQTGDNDISAMEVAAFALTTACGADLASDLTIGGLVWSQEMTAGSATQVQNDRGVAVLVPFVVAYRGVVTF